MCSVTLVQLVHPPPEIAVTVATLSDRRPATIMRSPTCWGLTVPPVGVSPEVKLTRKPVARVAATS